jgi:hypothetical protein
VKCYISCDVIWKQFVKNYCYSLWKLNGWNSKQRVNSVEFVSYFNFSFVPQNKEVNFSLILQNVQNIPWKKWSFNLNLLWDHLIHINFSLVGGHSMDSTQGTIFFFRTILNVVKWSHKGDSTFVQWTGMLRAVQACILRALLNILLVSATRYFTSQDGNRKRAFCYKREVLWPVLKTCPLAAGFMELPPSDP